jgi:hypothetical protein
LWNEQRQTYTLLQMTVKRPVFTFADWTAFLRISPRFCLEQKLHAWLELWGVTRMEFRHTKAIALARRPGVCWRQTEVDGRHFDLRYVDAENVNF